MDVERLVTRKMGLAKGCLSGKVAVVTGGGAGIGQQTALGLAALGARVALIDKDQAALHLTSLLLTCPEEDRYAICADIGREGEFLAAITEIEDHWQHIDILVNNAAESFIGSFAEETPEVWDRLFNSNIRYPAQAIKALLPGMLERGYGVIANVISLEGLTFSTAYSATKVGMRSLTTSLATEIGDEAGVSIFSFAPGIVDTPLVKTYFYPELARRFGMTMEDIITGVGGNPGYPGLMPAEDCGGALVYCIANAEVYSGQVASPFLPLAKAGVISVEAVAAFGGDQPGPSAEKGLAGVNTSLREYLKSVLEINANLEHRIRVRARELVKANEELQKALDEVKQLSGMLPICANCKNVRDDQGYWRRIERYLQLHTNADFSHSICPECEARLYGTEQWYSSSTPETDGDD